MHNLNVLPLGNDCVLGMCEAGERGQHLGLKVGDCGYGRSGLFTVEPGTAGMEKRTVLGCLDCMMLW